MELNKIYQMDCLEGLRQIENNSIDLILTDPPYGIDYQSAWRIDKEDRFDKLQNDNKFFIWWLNDAYRILKEDGAIAVFCRWDVQEVFKQAIEWAGFKIKSQVVWDRGNHGLGDLDSQFAPQHDIIWFAVKKDFKFQNGRPKSVLSFNRVAAENLLHPTEKPIDLMRYLVKVLSDKGDVVLDPFLGSGTTALAAKQAERKYIGFEIIPEYIEVANKRLKQEILLTIT